MSKACLRFLWPNSTKGSESSLEVSKVTLEAVSQVKALLSSGMTLADASAQVGLSIASCQKIKAGL